MNELTKAEMNKTPNKPQDITLEYQKPWIPCAAEHELQSDTLEIPAAHRGGKEIVRDMMKIW